MDALASVAQLARSLKGPLNFLTAEPEEIARLIPLADVVLPMPQRIYLADETSTPLTGFPLLQSEGAEELSRTLIAYLQAEEQTSFAHVTRTGGTDRREAEAAWERYKSQLARVSENITTSSYGRQFPGIFWLSHSLEVARWLKETPRRLLRLDANAGRQRGGAVKYQMLFRYLDRVVALSYDTVNRLASETEEAEQEIFPALLARMRDNVLIFSEDHISPDLAELGPYFAHYLSLDAKDFSFRLARLNEWNMQSLRTNSVLQNAVRHLLGHRAFEPRDLLKRPGYVAFLATLPEWNPADLLTTQQVSVWESLLVKLKEFELFHSLRRMVVPLRRDEQGRLAFRERSLNRTWAGPSWVPVSATTRPLDFTSPWVVDPQVARFGLIYDLTEFSQIISRLRRSGTEQQDRSFRSMFRFQRRVNTIARSHRLKLEKYLGDGAFYSAREAWRLLATSVLIQRAYQEALDEGFPFDQGLRIGLNYGHYRLLPIEGERPGAADRYEFFGHGVVELSRLTTGKATREIEDIQTLLVNRGYESDLVRRFFAPLLATRTDLVEKADQQRRFHAYLDANGHLVNEGIVGTGAFLARLADEPVLGPLGQIGSGNQRYIVATLRDGERDLVTGIRKLGVVTLKGLDPLAVYEIRDGAEFATSDVIGVETRGSVLDQVDADYTRRLGGGLG